MALDTANLPTFLRVPGPPRRPAEPAAGDNGVSVLLVLWPPVAPRRSRVWFRTVAWALVGVALAWMMWVP